MADNITEADERIIQLLTALNSTLGSYAASQESDTSDNFANQLSSTALVVSLIALVVALLQAVLQYVSSNSAQGDKCDTGAIGEYAKTSGTRKWSWRHWRRQYLYPELELSLANVCLGLHTVNYSKAGMVLEGLEGLDTRRPEKNMGMECYSWWYLHWPESKLISEMRMNFIRNGNCYLFQKNDTGWDLVLPRDLPMEYRCKWFFYRVLHGRTDEFTPRATWAQLLKLLNVDSTKITKLNRSRLVDANCIPSSIDVPAQKVKLTDLGTFAFCLGFKHVKINTKERTIWASGEIGTISTESMPGFGAVVRLQVFSPRPQLFLVEPDRWAMNLNHERQLLGWFDLSGTGRLETVRYSSVRGRFAEAGAVVDAGFTLTDEVNRWTEVTAKSCEHTGSNDAGTNLCLECMAIWQSLTGGRSWPTILLAASAACIPRTTTGFPSLAFLGPFLRIFQHMTHSLLNPRGSIWSLLTLESLRGGAMVLELLQHDFCRVSGHEYLTWESNFELDQLSWKHSACDLREIEQIEKILRSRMVIELKPVSTPKPDRGFRIPRFTFHDEMIGTETSNTSDPNVVERLTEGRLMPYIVELLNDFDPVAWSKHMRAKNSPKHEQRQVKVAERDKGEWRNHVQPHNVLLTQTFLLDLAITKYRLEHSISIEAVSEALVESWEEPISKATAPLKNLHKFLYQKAFPDQTNLERLEGFRGLADMIKVRMLCYIAYMMAIPDSTSLYKASLEDPIVLPMI